MKKSLLIAGIILVLISGSVASCIGKSNGEGSIYGDYRLVDKIPVTLTEYRLVLTEEGDFYYRIAGITSAIGKWEQQGDSLFFQFDNYTIETTVSDGKIIGGENSTILKGSWEKIK